MVSLKQYMHSGDLWGYLGVKNNFHWLPGFVISQLFWMKGCFPRGPPGHGAARRLTGGSTANHCGPSGVVRAGCISFLVMEKTRKPTRTWDSDFCFPHVAPLRVTRC